MPFIKAVNSKSAGKDKIILLKFALNLRTNYIFSKKADLKDHTYGFYC